MWEFSENGDSLHAVVSDEVLLQYDGNVCTLTPPRDRKTKEALKEGEKYRFTIKYSREDQEVVAYIYTAKKEDIFTPFGIKRFKRNPLK
jgi:hypothetical protein